MYKDYQLKRLSKLQNTICLVTNTKSSNKIATFCVQSFLIGFMTVAGKTDLLLAEHSCVLLLRKKKNNKSSLKAYKVSFSEPFSREFKLSVNSRHTFK